MAKVYGYIRVSSRDQNEDRQLIALREKQVPQEKLFMDKLILLFSQLLFCFFRVFHFAFFCCFVLLFSAQACAD